MRLTLITLFFFLFLSYTRFFCFFTIHCTLIPGSTNTIKDNEKKEKEVRIRWRRCHVLDLDEDDNVVLGETALELQHAVAVSEPEVVEMSDCMRHAARVPVLGVVDAKLEETADDDRGDKDDEVVAVGEGNGVDESCFRRQNLH